MGLTIADALSIFKTAAAKLDTFITVLESKSPDFIKPEEEAARQAFDAVAAGLDAVQIAADLAKAAETVKLFGGIVGGGAGPDLVP